MRFSCLRYALGVPPLCRRSAVVGAPLAVGCALAEPPQCGRRACALPLHRCRVAAAHEPQCGSYAVGVESRRHRGAAVAPPLFRRSAAARRVVVQFAQCWALPALGG